MQISLPGFVPNYRFGDVLVDEARSRIYITGGTGTSDLVITDLDGGNVRTIANVAPGAAGMALSPDGTKLYIAASDQDWLRIVDTTTFALSGQFAGKTDGTMSCPRDVAFAAGQLWVSWGCDNAPAGIGRVDLQTGAFQLNAIDSIDERISTAPLLATTPSQPNMVIAGETGTNPALVVWGAQDRIVPPICGEQYARLLPNARLHLIEACGHRPHLEKPDEFTRVVVDFLTAPVAAWEAAP